MRRELLQRADLLVALTQHERALLAKLAPRVRCEIVGNAVERHAIDGEAEIPPDLPEQTALLLGTVSKRKQQIATILAMREARYTPVVVGGLDGTVSEATLRSALEQVNGRWLGEIHAPEQVHAILSKSAALIQLSRSEGQSLAVLEALSLNVPVILSDLPGNKELAARYPDHVRLCATPQQLGHVLGELGQAPDEPPHVPTWDEVAEKLEGHYYQLLRS
jgi:glycosyltransferase involved in cell wall biosynthesis